MQTVDKAFKLLSLFSVETPEVGLSELARRAGFDKAATRRFLVALQKHQLIEQNPETRHYRLGPGLLHLAKIRETTFPLESILQTALVRLSGGTGETAHAGLLVHAVLTTLAIVFPPRANRVHLNLGEKLPLHATASGQVLLAFSPPEKLDDLPIQLNTYTTQTITDRQQLVHSLQQIRQQGFARVSNTYEDEVTGIAVPFFDAHALPQGTLAVATPSARMSAKLELQIRQQLLLESQSVTQALGGVLPADFSQHLYQETP
ncbi:MAG: IclR family transcriptional regulator [Thiothrix sp.]|nr:IclR family transcriptional regulator [Thiothrix sp.]HPQ94683.1 IclR family transcriptional regulator [Thiolinea sp.]